MNKLIALCALSTASLLVPLAQAAAAPLNELACQSQSAPRPYLHLRGYALGGDYWMIYGGAGAAKKSMKALGQTKHVVHGDQIFFALGEGRPALVLKLGAKADGTAHAAQGAKGSLWITADRQEYPYHCQAEYGSEPGEPSAFPSDDVPGTDCENHPEQDPYHCDPDYCNKGGCPP